MNSAEVAIIAHVDDPDTSRLEPILRLAEIPFQVVRPSRGQSLPDPHSLAGIICLGGPMSAYEEASHPFLSAEKSYLRKAAEAEIPVLGICLGAQLLADALGGAAVAGPSLECGYVQVDLTHAGQHDPILHGLGGPYFSFHTDTFLPPPGAVALARSDRYLHAFRVGSALAVQFHPEISVDGIRRLTNDEYEKVDTAGVDVTQIAAEAERQAPDIERNVLLLTRWVTSLSSSPTVPPANETDGTQP